MQGKIYQKYMNPKLEGLKAVMFDLGGVIIELDYSKAANHFASEAGISVDQIGDLLVTSSILQEFEVGGVSEQTFRDKVCRLLNIKLTGDRFDEIWNSLLGEIHPKRVEAIKNLPFQTLILSNTNSIHERAFNEILEESTRLNNLYQLVDKVYFSHEVKMRKPDREIYENVLADQQRGPGEILFIDDRLDNIQAAEQLGFQVFQNKNINDWLELF